MASVRGSSDTGGQGASSSWGTALGLVAAGVAASQIRRKLKAGRSTETQPGPPGEVVDALANMAAFFGHDEEFSWWRADSDEDRTNWERRLHSAWPSLSADDKQIVLQMPDTWQQIKLHWAKLNEPQRQALRDNWLPLGLRVADS